MFLVIGKLIKTLPSFWAVSFQFELKKPAFKFITQVPSVEGEANGHKQKNKRIKTLAVLNHYETVERQPLAFRTILMSCCVFAALQLLYLDWKF